MAKTFKEQLDEVEKLKQRLAIWEAIHHLVDDKFISKDGRKVSGIRVPGSGYLVPEETIEDVLQTIGEGPIAELRNQIEEIENLQVVVLSETKATA